jgi:polyisoprenoid-binding protein YceI
MASARLDVQLAGRVGLLYPSDGGRAGEAQAARYEIDPDHLTVAFLVDHVGYAKVLGMFRTARGSYRFDEATATLSAVRIEVDTASVFSNQRSATST